MSIRQPGPRRSGLGGRFRPGTRLRSVVEQFYAIATSRVAATHHPMDPQAAEFYLAHQDEIRDFRNEPLWRKRLAARVRVETVSPAQAKRPEAAEWTSSSISSERSTGSETCDP